MDKQAQEQFDHAESGVASFAYVAGTAEERRLLRKIDMRMLPILWGMYVLNYMDRSNIGNARTGGMGAALGMSNNDYSAVISFFFITYVFSEIPANMILTRVNPSTFLGGAMCLWGSITIAFMGVNSVNSLIGLRIVLGAVEGCFFPGVLFLLSEWYTPREQAKRFAFFYTASVISGAFSGILAGVVITGMDGLSGVPGWKWLFVIEGIATVAVSSIGFFFLPDWPSNSKFLTVDERTLAVARLNPSRVVKTEVISHYDAFKMAVKDPKVWAVGMMFQFMNVGGTVGYFLPGLVATFGYTGRNIQFMTAPVFMVALVIAITTAWHSDKKQERGLHMIVVAGLACFCWTIPLMTQNTTARYIGITFAASGVVSWIPLAPAYLMEILANDPREKRAISLALINSLANIGSVYASFTWPTTDSPYYHLGFGFAAACTGTVCLGGFAFYWFVARHAIAANKALQAETAEAELDLDQKI